MIKMKRMIRMTRMIKTMTAQSRGHPFVILFVSFLLLSERKTSSNLSVLQKIRSHRIVRLIDQRRDAHQLVSVFAQSFATNGAVSRTGRNVVSLLETQRGRTNPLKSPAMYVVEWSAEEMEDRQGGEEAMKEKESERSFCVSL